MRTELDDLRTSEAEIAWLSSAGTSPTSHRRHIKCVNHKQLLSSRAPRKMADLTRLKQRKETASLSPRLQSYANQSLAELTEKLVKCGKEERSENLTSRTRDIIYVLKAQKLRHSSNAHAFYGHGGVEALLVLLSLCASCEGRDRGLLLATLANLCALHKGCRSKVCKQGEWLNMQHCKCVSSALKN